MASPNSDLEDGRGFLPWAVLAFLPVFQGPSKPKHPNPTLSCGAWLSAMRGESPWPVPPFPWHRAPGRTRGIGTRVTDSDGRFQFKSVPPGVYRIIVRLLGYRELQDTLRVEPFSDLDLQLPLSVSPIELEPLVVVSDRRPPPGPMRDFENRRQTHSGTFFDREDIERRNPWRFTDLFRLVPGARVVPAGPYDSAILLRGGCRPVIWVDGMQLSTSDGIDHILQPMDLESVEVYHSANLPVEFGMNSCGAIVAWTRRGEPTVREGSFWRRVAFGAAFLVLALAPLPADPPTSPVALSPPSEPKASPSAQPQRRIL